MLYHDNGIAQIPQMLQRSQQLIIIPLMKSDTRLIQNICNTHQPGTDLRSQTDALRFPS